jgi:hypothetical protein
VNTWNDIDINKPNIAFKGKGYTDKFKVFFTKEKKNFII